MAFLREYQSSTVARVVSAIGQGAQAPCVVMPTGAGKTITASAIVSALDVPTLWLAHRHELVDQARSRLPPSVHVTTVQGLLASGDRPDAKLLVLDECHHYLAAEWSTVCNYYSGAIRLGLTATPCRQDGSPLGDIFDSLVVGATYSELIRDGHLTPCEVYTPTYRQSGLAMPVLDAIDRYALDKQTIVFCASVSEARDIGCPVIDGTTPQTDRQSILARFRACEIPLVSNVFVLTEGFDAPCASVGILARGCSHAGTYLQIAGRLLRPYPGKQTATLVDLCGSANVHGSPTEDREYSLSGTPIERKDKRTIWQCKFCGYATWTPPANRRCKLCNRTLPEPEALRIQRARLHRQEHNATASESEKQAEYQRLLHTAKQAGRKPGWAAYVYKARYGHWPRRES